MAGPGDPPKSLSTLATIVMHAVRERSRFVDWTKSRKNDTLDGLLCDAA
jgi:hypothetical protein